MFPIFHELWGLFPAASTACNLPVVIELLQVFTETPMAVGGLCMLLIPRFPDFISFGAQCLISLCLWLLCFKKFSILVDYIKRTVLPLLFLEVYFLLPLTDLVALD